MVSKSPEFLQGLKFIEIYQKSLGSNFFPATNTEAVFFSWCNYSAISASWPLTSCQCTIIGDARRRRRLLCSPAFGACFGNNSITQTTGPRPKCSSVSNRWSNRQRRFAWIWNTKEIWRRGTGIGLSFGGTATSRIIRNEVVVNIWIVFTQRTRHSIWRARKIKIKCWGIKSGNSIIKRGTSRSGRC